MGNWFTLWGILIKYDDYCKLVGATVRYLNTLVMGLLPLQETFLSLKNKMWCQERKSGEYRSFSHPPHPPAQAESIKKPGALTFI